MKTILLIILLSTTAFSVTGQTRHPDCSDIEQTLNKMIEKADKFMRSHQFKKARELY